MDTQIHTPFYADKSFWLTVLSIFAPLVASKLGVQLNIEVIAGAIAAVVSFIVMSKWKQVVVTKAQILAASSEAGKAADPAAVLNQ